MDGSFLMAVLNLGWHISTTLTSSVTPFQMFEPSTFTAAVYEHKPFIPGDPHQICSRAEALEIMKKNLEVYSQQTDIAKQQGAQIIVFPEDGLYGTGFVRESIFPFLEKIPDPKKTKWSPCSDPRRYPDTEVQHSLSCMAKETGLYVVANMGDAVPCNTRQDPKCPSDGQYQYNTDVAFDPDGTLVAKYHKTHLFVEPQFNSPKPEVVYFDTPFGRFGMIVCFDSLFKEPAVTMVTEHKITNIAFPTAWRDALPLVSAIGYHSSFARGLGVNLLSANLHRPSQGSVGSGIFTPKGMASFYYSDNPLSPGKLLVSTIDKLKQKTKTETEDDSNSKNFNDVHVMSIHSTDTLPHQVVSSGPISPKDFKKKSETFQSYLNYDQFTFEALEEPSGNISVCKKNVCCSLTYSFSDESRSSSDLFAFGVYDGLYTVKEQLYFQICTLVKCADNTNRSSCGTGTKVSNTRFKSISMTGQFQTKFVYPQIVMAKNEQLLLGDRKSWSFHDTTMTSGSGLDQPLISATLLGRYYSRDDGVSKVGV